MKRLFAKKPARNVELSDKNVRSRAILAGLFLVAGLIAFGVFLFSLLGKQSGWQEIELTTAMAQVSDEIIFNYNIGASGFGASAEYKKVAQCYTDAVIPAYKLFDVYDEYDDVVNICTINNHPNTEYTVDPTLYRAFEMLEKSGTRYHYLADMYILYQNMFNLETPGEYAITYDPYKSISAEEYFAEYASFANSEEQVKLELLGDNRVRLFVSEEYLEFAENNEIESFIGLGWIQNAFVIDVAAEALIEQGFTRGSLSSVYGYIRNLDSSTEYSYNFFASSELVIYPAARLDYSGAGSFVAYRDYPLYDADYIRYYPYANGTAITLYIDTADGKFKSACRNMTCYSKEMGLSELIISTAPAYILDSVDTEQLAGLSQKGITTVWADEAKVIYQMGDGVTAVAIENDGVLFEIEKIAQ